MKTRSWTATLLLATSIAPVLRAAESGLTLRQLKGRWIRKDCLESLRATRSPMKSRCEGLGFLDINDQGWQGIFNFHDGGARHAVNDIAADAQAKNLYVLEETTGDKDKASQSVRVIHRDKDMPIEIQWMEQTAQKRASSEGRFFVRADGPFELQANRIALEGEYADEHGKVFRFTKASKAQWPDRTFAYELGLDFAEGPDCDYFQVLNEKTPQGFPVRYGFRHDGGKLMIYPMITTQDEFRCDTKPLHVLAQR